MEFKGIRSGSSTQLIDATDRLILKSVDDEIATELKAIALHAVDLKFCQYCLRELPNVDCNKDSDLVETYWVACITKYYKCFGHSKSRTRLQAELVHPDVADFRFFKALRDKHIVHDENSFSDAFVVLGYDAIDINSNAIELDAFSIHLFLINETEIDRLKNLVESTVAYVEARRSEIINELISKYKTFDKEELESLPDVVVSSPPMEDVFKKR